MNNEINCTAEEAPVLMGLTDIRNANEVYVDHGTNAMHSVTGLDQLEELPKKLAPIGQMGLRLFQGLAELALSIGKKDIGNDKD